MYLLTWTKVIYYTGTAFIIHSSTFSDALLNFKVVFVKCTEVTKTNDYFNYRLQRLINTVMVQLMHLLMNTSCKILPSNVHFATISTWTFLVFS